MDEKQYLKMRARAEEEYKKNLEAIDRVWHMAHPDKPLPGTRVSPGASVSPSVSLTASQTPFVLTNVVDRIVAEMPESSEISQPIVLARLLELHPDLRSRVKKDQIKPRIAGRLSKMERQNELIKMRESHGSEPAVFRKGRLITEQEIDELDALPLT
jgi:hypothetical protein